MSSVLALSTVLAVVVAVTTARSFGTYSDKDFRPIHSNRQSSDLSHANYRLLQDYEYPSLYDALPETNGKQLPFLHQQKRSSFNDLIQRLLALQGEIRSNARKSQIRFGGGRK